VTNLRDTRDASGSRKLWAEQATPDGDVVIHGVDHGDGVEQVFGEGFREYEWVWTIRAAEVPKLLAALGATGPVLAALGERFSGDNAGGLSEFLDEHGIPYEAWSRMGE
jgi:hypothetical protein